MANYIITRELTQKFQVIIEAPSEDDAMDIVIDDDVEWALTYENDDLFAEEEVK